MTPADQSPGRAHRDLLSASRGTKVPVTASVVITKSGLLVLRTCGELGEDEIEPWGESRRSNFSKEGGQGDNGNAVASDRAPGRPHGHPGVLRGIPILGEFLHSQPDLDRVDGAAD